MLTDTILLNVTDPIVPTFAKAVDARQQPQLLLKARRHAGEGNCQEEL